MSISKLIGASLGLGLLAGACLWLRTDLSQSSVMETALSHAEPLHPRNNDNSAVYARFDRWMQSLPNDVAELEPALLQEGIALARLRRERMSALMRHNPDAALQQAISYSEYHKLPAELRAEVEQPFSALAQIDLIAICDDDPATPEFSYSIAYQDGTRGRMAKTAQARAPYSKRGLPTQGIRLDGWSAVRNTVFHQLDDKDREWALSNLPMAGKGSSVDFTTGLDIEGEPLIAIAGGMAFAFANETSLSVLENGLRSLDDLIGLNIGSSALFENLAHYGDAMAFPLPEILATYETAAMEESIAARDFLVIRAAFADFPDAAQSQASLLDTIQQSVAPSLGRFSYGKTTVNATVTADVYAMPGSDTFADEENSYDQAAIYDAAIAAYQAAGNSDPTLSYDIVAISFPRLETLGFAGLATLGGDRQWLNGAVGAETILHELGHNYGLRHASFWRHNAGNASSVNPVDDTGATDEYGDPFDVMGEGRIPAGHFHMAAKQLLGWLDADQWLSLTGPADNGVHRIYQFDDELATGQQALRIAKSTTDDYYWLGFRQSYPGVPHLDRGAYLLWQRADGGHSANRAWLVDTTPNSADGKVDAGIDLGRTYADLASQVFITPLAIGGDAQGQYIDVVVNFGPFPGNNAPHATFSAPAQAVARQPIAFSASASDPDGDQLAYHWDFGDGAIEASAASIEHSFPVGGNYTLTLTVSDTKGGSTTLQAEIEVSDPLNESFERASGTTNHLYALAANSSRVVAAGKAGSFRYSTSGETWTAASISGSVNNLSVADICWTGSEFIAVGQDYNFNLSAWVGVILASSDGSSWSRVLTTSNAVGNWGFQSVASNEDGSLVVVSGADANLYVRRGQTGWQQLDLGLSDFPWQNATAVAYGNGRFIVSGYRFNADHRLAIHSSVDTLTWHDLAPSSGIDNWKGLSELAHFNEHFIGSGFFARAVYSDDQGQSWTSNQLGNWRQVTAFAYGNGIYSAHGLDKGPDGNLSDANATPIDLYSTDGRNWQPATVLPSRFNDRIFFADTFISVGDSGTIRQTAAFAAPEAPSDEEVLLTGFDAWIVDAEAPVDQRGAEDNPDGDWASNYLEYALGSDPMDSASAAQPPAFELDAQGRIAVSIHRFAKTDVALSLEVSIDLLHWETLPATASEDTEILLRLISDDIYEPASPLFVRIKAAAE